MKKIILLFAGLFLFYACLNTEDHINYGYEILPVDEYTTPAAFTFGEKDTITVKYTLVNGCYSFDNIYYEYQDTARIVGVRALVVLDKDCTEIITQKEHEIIVTATQKEDYVFKFYKGIDANVENMFGDAPIEKSAARARTPERKAAVKRGRESFDDDEPDLKKVIREDDDMMDNVGTGMIDSFEMKDTLEDRNIVYHAI